jgi:hypothetical protein
MYCLRGRAPTRQTWDLSWTGGKGRFHFKHPPPRKRKAELKEALVGRRGGKKVLVAVGHKILIIYYHILKHKTPY